MTVLQELKKHFDRELDLGFLKQKDVERIHYYIDTFFIEKEKQQIVLAHEQGRSDKHNDFIRDGEKYYSEVSDSTCH